MQFSLKVKLLLAISTSVALAACKSPTGPSARPERAPSSPRHDIAPDSIDASGNIWFGGFIIGHG